MKTHKEWDELNPPDEADPLSFYQCDHTGCALQFRDKSQFQQHLTTHATKPFDCEACSKYFAMEENYKTHLDRVHGQEATGSLLVDCPFCWGIFSEVNLLGHLRKHFMKMDETPDSTSGFLCEGTFNFYF